MFNDPNKQNQDRFISTSYDCTVSGWKNTIGYNWKELRNYMYNDEESPMLNITFPYQGDYDTLKVLTKMPREFIEEFKLGEEINFYGIVCEPRGTVVVDMLTRNRELMQSHMCAPTPFKRDTTDMVVYCTQFINGVFSGTGILKNMFIEENDWNISLKNSPVINYSYFNPCLIGFSEKENNNFNHPGYNVFTNPFNAIPVNTTNPRYGDPAQFQNNQVGIMNKNIILIGITKGYDEELMTSLVSNVPSVKNMK